jgi:hypothetical protein
MENFREDLIELSIEELDLVAGGGGGGGGDGGGDKHQSSCGCGGINILSNNNILSGNVVVVEL